MNQVQRLCILADERREALGYRVGTKRGDGLVLDFACGYAVALESIDPVAYAKLAPWLLMVLPARGSTEVRRVAMESARGMANG
jgi:hypothetical protein